MRKRLLALPFLLLVSYYSFSQGVGIGTINPDLSAALDITSAGKGLLIPRMSTASINTIPNPAKGLLVFDSLTNKLMANTGTPVVPNWQPVAAGNNAVWNLTGNSGINPASQFIGNTDNQPLHFRVNNIQSGELNPVNGNIFWGLLAGQANSTGSDNIAIGRNALKLNTTISNTVAIGDSALFNNSTGILNTAIGSKSLFSNTDGAENTASGNQALFSNITGSRNNATGWLSQFKLTTGNDNVATGVESLFSNTTGNSNTAYGNGSLALNDGGEGNVAVGFGSLITNTFGSFNTAVGYRSMFVSIAGSQFNTVVGANAANQFTVGFNNTLVGANADFTQNGLFNAVALGEGARCSASSQVRLGNTLTTSIGGVVGFTNLSDGRYKKNIQEAVKGIDFIMKLRPVTYQLDMAGLNKKLNITTSAKINELSKKGLDENETKIFSGFVAQEVEQAAKDAKYDFSGVDKPKNENDMYGLRYAEFVVPLVKAMQEQQQMIEDLKKQNADLQKRLSILEKK